jgi:hypothetical protein
MVRSRAQCGVSNHVADRILRDGRIAAKFTQTAPAMAPASG